MALDYDPPKQTYRFLFSNGMTEDVTACRDDSDMRGWVLDQMKDRMDVTDKDLRIVGVADL